MRFLFRSTFFLVLFPILISYSQTDSLIISEVMFYPSAPNSEFIEIFNLSHQNSIDLSKFQIIYYTANADTFIEAGDGSNLPPRTFAVVFEGDYDFTNGIYSAIVPEKAIKLQIEDNAFGSSGMANTSDRTIHLVDSLGDTVDVYIYSANNNSGISDEKIILNKDSSYTNWANSLILNGTPGKENSISPKEFDLSVANLYYTPTEIFEGDEVELTAIIKNIGTSISNDFTALLFLDTNRDSIAQQNEIIVSQNYTSLSPDDSTELFAQSNSLLVGNYDLFILVDYSSDENISNNLKSMNINVFPKLNSYNDIIISEIMLCKASIEHLSYYNTYGYVCVFISEI